MDKYCRNCGNQVSPEEKFCKQCGAAICEATQSAAENAPKAQKSDTAEHLYEFFASKATFKFKSTPIHTIVSVDNNRLTTSVECKSRMLSKKKLNGQVNISDIGSVRYNQYAAIALFDLFLFGVLLFVVAMDASYFIAYALLSGVILWRTLVPSLEIRTKDNRRLNILFSPRDNKTEMEQLVSQITGKEADAQAKLKIPFSAKPFLAILIFIVVGLAVTAIFA